MYILPSASSWHFQHLQDEYIEMFARQVPIEKISTYIYLAILKGLHDSRQNYTFIFASEGCHEIPFIYAYGDRTDSVYNHTVLKSILMQMYRLHSVRLVINAVLNLIKVD